MTLLWTIITIGLIALEAATVQLICIWFAGGAFAALIVALLSFSIWAQIITFVLVSLLLLIFTRKIVNKLKTKNVEKTNVDALLGETAVVISPIDNTLGCGSVKIRGMQWSARSENGTKIEKDTIVTVKKVEGVKLIVSTEETK